MKSPVRKRKGITLVVVALTCCSSIFLSGCREDGNAGFKDSPSSTKTSTSRYQASLDGRSTSAGKRAVAADKGNGPLPKEQDSDIAVMEWRGQDIGEGMEKIDADKKAPFQIDVFQGKGSESVNRVTVDLGRNGVVDQVWLFHGSHGKIILRKSEQTGEGHVAKDYEWDEGTWKVIGR